jgi:hypothetical protein
LVERRLGRVMAGLRDSDVAPRRVDRAVPEQRLAEFGANAG